MWGGRHCDMSSRCFFNKTPIVLVVAEHSCQPLQESPQLHRVASPKFTPFPAQPTSNGLTIQV